MNEPGPGPRPSLPAALGGVIGGLVVAVIGGVLLATGVIDAGDSTTKVIRETPSATVRNASSGGQTVGEIYRREGKGVVFVEAQGVSNNSPFGLPDQGSTASGSGFVVDKAGYILTNDHVVAGANRVRVRFNADSDPIAAQVKGTDPSSDLALLKIDPSKAKLVPLPLGDSSQVKVGEPVLAIGNPFGLQFERTVTSGIVSAVQRRIQAPNLFSINGAIQTDASINPGNSGGPLINANGEVVGINSQIATGGGSGSVGIGFAVPINLAKKILPQLEQGKKIERAFLGVTTTAITKQLANDLNLPTTSGALVVDVASGGPADKAGIRAGNTQTTSGLRIGGDIITKIDGKAVKGPDALVNAVSSKKVGDTVEITYLRRRSTKTAKVKLANRPRNAPGSQSQQGQGGGGLIP